MSINQPTEQSFLKDVATHEMRILKDDGVYRHVRFKRPDSSSYHFDLITYPGYLVYSGDMGCYVFSRLTDMFKFFRTDSEHLGAGKTLGINLGYWAEKLQSVSRFGEGYEEFDEEKFERVIKERFKSWARDNRHRTTKEDRRELWEAIQYDILDADGDQGGFRKQIAAHDFSHRVNGSIVFHFDDLFEYSFTRYTYHFVWCCYALAWGIQQYDKSKIQEVADGSHLH